MTRNKAGDDMFPGDLSRQRTITVEAIMPAAARRPVRGLRSSVDSCMGVISAIMSPGNLPFSERK